MLLTWFCTDECCLFVFLCRSERFLKCIYCCELMEVGFFVAFQWIDAVVVAVVVAFGRRGWRLGRRRERRRRWRSMRWWSRSGEERLELRFSLCIRRRRRSKIPQICLELVFLFSFFLSFTEFLFLVLVLHFFSVWTLENSCEIWRIESRLDYALEKVSSPDSTNGYVCGFATSATQQAWISLGPPF